MYADILLYAFYSHTGLCSRSTLVAVLHCCMVVDVVAVVCRMSLLVIISVSNFMCSVSTKYSISGKTNVIL